ncbi:MAG: TonB-dependent receptor plug domain-containing protein, partial [Bacteroidota bacterium]
QEPGAQVTVKEEQIAPLNLGQDLPFMLRFTPSIVVTSDAGNGVGYTGMRIRGSDQTRINVTINGIPYNDPESQGVFWVNLPDFSSSVNDVQIQRGVGSSTNGAGAFGGSVSLNTLRIPEVAYASISNSVGSFNTFKHTIGFGSGRIGNHFKVEGRLSQISSDGFIDRAESDLKSYYVTGSWDNGRSSIQAVVFGGNERTYQSWYGTPQSRIENDIEGMLTHAANEGYSEAQTQNLLNSGRTYNFYLYENEVDDYSQDNYQLHLKHRFGSRLTAQLSGHYTYGRGFFEQQRLGDDLSDYGLNSIVLNAVQQFSDATDGDGNPINEDFAGNYSWDQVEISHDIVTDSDGNPITNDDGETLLNSVAQISQSDVIRRRWLSNDFYGLTYSLNYQANRFNVIVGGAYNDYDGDHFGELIWMSNPAGTEHGDLYYLNNGRKKDFNVYAKASYRVNEKLELFGDLQYRNVTYFTEGVDSDRRNISVGDTLDFVNPKAGLNYYINNRNNVYVSYSIGNREPVRNDYIDALDGRKPEAETLQDLEFGFRRNMEKYRLQVNFYNMVYDNQLVLTGELNDVGSAVRTNVAKSYRRGVELQLVYQIIPGLQWGLNATYSQNKIEDYNYFVYDYTNGFDIVEENFGETDISFSPDIIANSMLSFRFFENDRNRLEAAWMTTYVSDQFLDNTSNEERQIDAYLVDDFRITYSLFNRGMKELQINALVNNVLDQEYSSNGYTYSYIVGDRVTENFFYPQAGRNFMVGLNLLF